ncbi:hypothetical protein [Massilia antarctica]|uniref:hypothetical protein n=1 Tax=Massilia antarctica TaxID=2765360 RepID=UPI0006BB5D9B|nr:hypothetical protein [Massilia sp. H27-R4]MCY0910689.1 hypothetical protein [Massilia sp. H27-R4]CUI08938.1 Gll3595 protein [Janthinobacterium sp. CG23_2]CUU32724.1 Gll3595 protein [Janthinobacterium sp. CG23_2]
MKFVTQAFAATVLFSACAAHAHQSHTGGIQSAPANTVDAPFDIVHTRITKEGNTAVFHIAVSGKAGRSHPSAVGKLAGSKVFSYVWPTTLDPSVVGFGKGAGILALAVTSHPDFDDTPLYDENGDGNLNNDGDLWHSHWVVLTPDDACGKGALKVVDIAAGTTPKLPKTWPGLPLLIDSPGYSPVFKESTLEVRVPFDDVGVLSDAGFDGVTAALRVNASMHSPLLCVANVFKVASGSLSLPGKVGQ